ncbi:MAG: glutamate ligase domain-containing protein, partial [Candidatus Dormibacteria bacterium]
LDFHGSFEAYAAAKGQMLAMLGGDPAGGGVATDLGVLVTAAEDPELDRFRRRWPGLQLEFGIEAGDLRAVQIEELRDGTGFRLLFLGQETPVQSQLVGRHNVLNAMAAASVGLVSGARLDEVAAGLSRFAGVVGRLQRVDKGQPFNLIVDFAHTVHGLEEVLRALRVRTRGRIWVVFGSAGGRDALKRPGLGQTVARLADRAILTTDDPRHESPAAIAGEISAGMEVEGWHCGAEFQVILDRAAAVRVAVAAAGPGDTVLLAGKGGQRQMYLSGGGVPWDDVAVAEAALAEEGYGVPI